MPVVTVTPVVLVLTIKGDFPCLSIVSFVPIVASRRFTSILTVVAELGMLPFVTAASRKPSVTIVAPSAILPI